MSIIIITPSRQCFPIPEYILKLVYCHHGSSESIQKYFRLTTDTFMENPSAQLREHGLSKH